MMQQCPSTGDNFKHLTSFFTISFTLHHHIRDTFYMRGSIFIMFIMLHMGPDSWKLGVVTWNMGQCHNVVTKYHRFGQLTSRNCSKLMFGMVDWNIFTTYSGCSHISWISTQKVDSTKKLYLLHSTAVMGVGDNFDCFICQLLGQFWSINILVVCKYLCCKYS